MPLTFAIDYDNTFSADPALFANLVFTIHRAHHRVVIVTGRSDEGEWGTEVRRGIREYAELDGVPIVFAGLTWKRQAAEKAGYKVDIWIDDYPEYIAPQDPEIVKHKRGVI